MGVKAIIYSLRSLTQREKGHLKHLSRFLAAEQIKRLEKYVRQKRASIEDVDIPYSKRITSIEKYIQIKPKDEKIEAQIEEINKTIVKNLEGQMIKEFSDTAWKIIPQLLAPQIVGFDDVKKAIALQLFSKEPFHILLIGDPGTGKTQLLSAAEAIAPISSFGLGSGTSSVGLTVTLKDKEVKPGLLPLAHNGIALIDELNLLKKDDRGGLYNVMEKGFLTYDKGGAHMKFDAKCSILATANPASGKIKGTTLEVIKKEIPFDSALLSRFHLIFLVKEADVEQFMAITDGVLKTKTQINKADLEFIKNYVKVAKELEPEVTEEFNDMVKKFIREIKEQEGALLIDITPRFIIGLRRLIEAAARLELRTKIQKEDIWKAIEIFSVALKTITFQ